MESFCGAFPVLKGKEKAGREYAETCMGSRRKECLEYFQRVGLMKQSWHLQNLPQGTVVLVYFEAPNAAKTFELLAQAKEPFTLWYKQQMQQITGVDLNKPPEGPMPEQIFSLSRYGESRSTAASQ